MDAPTPIRIDVRALSFSPGFTTVLTPTSLSARPGEAVGVLGPSGAGKSTLIKLMSGFNRDGDGDVLYNGVSLRSAYDRIRAFVGYVPQDDIVHPSLTARSELTFAARLRLPDLPMRQIERRVDRVLAVLELTEAADRRIRRLSGGQRKRVSIGVELLTEPPVLFLDEPTSGLDPALEEKMMTLFQKLARQGRSVLVTTHVMESLEKLDLVLILMKGRLIFAGPPMEALQYFKVDVFADVYQRLNEHPPGEWQSRFRSSRQHATYVEKRLGEPLQHGLPAPKPALPPPAKTVTATATRPSAAPAGTADPRADEKTSVDAELEALRKEIGQ